MQTILMITAFFVAIAVFFLIIGFVEPSVIMEQVRRDRVRNIADKDLEALRKKYQEENNIVRKIQRFFENYQNAHSGHAKNARAEKREKEFAHKLYAAGMAVTPAVYNFLLGVVTFITVIISIFLVAFTEADSSTHLIELLVGFAGPYILFKYYVGARVTRRRAQMENQLPDVLDLLAISVGAGMGFDQALTYITETMTGPLIDEMAVLQRELQLGKSRVDAFTDFGERSNSDSIRNFSTAVIQATEMGIPLHDMLVAQATSARNEHVSKVRAKAARASIRMLLPMVGFIFPVLFIVLMGPAVINVLNAGIF